MHLLYKELLCHIIDGLAIANFYRTKRLKQDSPNLYWNQISFFLFQLLNAFGRLDFRVNNVKCWPSLFQRILLWLNDLQAENLLDLLGEYAGCMVRPVSDNINQFETRNSTQVRRRYAAVVFICMKRSCKKTKHFCIV